MAYLAIEDFKIGMDRRRSRFAGVPGSLWSLKNAHITRGGEVERCKKFVLKYALPPGLTFGVLAIGEVLYVFGSGPAPSGIPSGVTYQRLVHPDSSVPMTEVIDARASDGKAYVVARFSDGNVFHFYDGALVSEWQAGVVRSYMVNNSGIASHLAALINDDVRWSATVVSNTLEVSGEDTTDFTAQTEVETSGDAALAQATTQEVVTAIAEVRATATFTINGGVPATAATGSVTLATGASGSVDSITVNSVEMLPSPVPFNTSLDQTASDVADAINSNTTTPVYIASAAGAVVTLTAAVSAGAAPNTFVVAASGTTITFSTANMAGGVSCGITSITVGGTEVLGATVNLVTTYSILAAGVASQITDYSSTPDCDGSSSGAVVTVIMEEGSGYSGNERTVVITTTGGVTVSTSPATTAGGVPATAGQLKKIAFTVTGTFTEEDKFTIILTQGIDVAVFGASGGPAEVGETIFPFKSKIYSGKNSVINFSGVNAPTRWNRDTVLTALAGMGFFNAATQDEGSQEISGFGSYNGELAVFFKAAIQTLSADAEGLIFLQTIGNTGTDAPKSITPYGNRDLFYLETVTGIRSLRARDSSNTPEVNDIGTAIDVFVQEQLASLSDADIANSVGVIEPLDGRLLMGIGDRIYAFSSFNASKVFAWSYYEPGFSVSAFAKMRKKLFVRSGDSIYMYGGDDNITYPDDDELNVEVITPFHAMGKPATKKKITGFDIGCENQWECSYLFDMRNPDEEHRIGVFSGPTYQDMAETASLKASHLAAKMTCSTGGRAVIANMAMHYRDPSEAA